MCGIAGLVLSPSAAPPAAGRGGAADRHAAPSRAGRHRHARGRPRRPAAQPAGDHRPGDRRPAVVRRRRRRWCANGEIYNYRELRAAMHGVSFATNSDCELPLHLWLRDGADYTRDLRGMYAIAIHERVQRSVTLTPRSVRHQAAVYRAGGGRPGLRLGAAGAAGSGPGRAPRASRRRARSCCNCSSPPAPTRSSRASSALLPGETLTCADGRVLDRRRIARLPDGRAGGRSTRTRRWSRLDRALEESVDLHQRSDVPYGMFLSGGIDSATLLTLMARLNSQPVLAFTAGLATCPMRPTSARRPPRWRRRSARGTKRSRSTRRWSGGTCRRSLPAWTIRPPTTRSSPPGSSPAARGRT